MNRLLVFVPSCKSMELGDIGGVGCKDVVCVTDGFLDILFSF